MVGIYPLKGYLKIFGWLRIGLAVFFIAPPMGFVGEDGAVTGVFDVIKLELPNIAGKNFGDGVGLGVEIECGAAFGRVGNACGAGSKLDAADIADACGLAGDGAGNMWVVQHQAAVLGVFAGEHDEAGVNGIEYVEAAGTPQLAFMAGGQADNVVFGEEGVDIGGQGWHGVAQLGGRAG